MKLSETQSCLILNGTVLRDAERDIVLGETERDTVLLNTERDSLA